MSESAMADVQPMRIAHITSGLEVGGLEKLLVEFARLADRTRFELTFISLSDRGALAQQMESLGCEVHVMNAPTGFRPRLVPQLAGLLRRLRVDMVHTHDIRPLIYGAPAARVARVPGVIHTRHGQDFRDTRRQMTLHNLAARLTDRFVCISEDNAELTIHGGVAAKRVRTIRNGVDLARFSHSGPQPGGPAVTVARLSPEKSIHTLLRACAVAVRERPSFRLKIAGDGPCRAALESLRDELGLEGVVTFLGPVDDVPALLAEAGMFVLPSLTEGISLTLLEAMACGLPVVATRVGGNPEVVVDSETGLLVPAGQPEILARAILHLDRDPELCRRFGSAGRRRVERYFDVRQMVAAYELLYLASGQQLASAATPALAVLRRDDELRRDDKLPEPRPQSGPTHGTGRENTAQEKTACT